MKQLKIISEIKRLYRILQFKLAVKRCDYLHSITNQRYYALPYTRQRILVASNRDLRRMRKNGMLYKNMRHNLLTNYCLYYTAKDRTHLGMDTSQMLENKEKWKNYHV